MSLTREEEKIDGLPVLQNWIARNDGLERYGIYEFPLYTDARMTGQIQRADWPYAFLNTVPIRDEPGYVQAPLILRVDAHIAQSERPDFSKTDVSLYHGGLMTDEIAALASLCIGVRIRAGGESRRFDGMEQDPLGRPVAWDRRPIPRLDLDKDRLVLPDIVGAHSLDELKRLEWLLQISAAQSVALVRAARLYQDALWIAESEPALAWLMFVSALETAANQWQAASGTAIERLAYTKPDLVKILEAAGGDTLVKDVADQIEQSLGATRKFVEFSLQFLPSPPSVRPSEAFQIPWDSASMKKVLRLIYGYRSKALHGGTPFPAPMCDHAFRISATEGFAERGTVGLAASTRGGVWLAKDVPISLHTFHHIVREALLGWWKSMADG